MPRKFFPRKTKSITSNKVPFTVYSSHTLPAPLKFYRDGYEEILSAIVDPGTVNCGLFFQSERLKDDSLYPLQLELLHFRKKGEDDMVSYGECIKVLDNFEYIFLKCHYIFIEEQMGIATSNIRIFHHLIGYFMTRYKDRGNRPLLVVISNSSKLTMLDCPYKKKADYKKWSPKKALELLENEYVENKKCIEELTKKGKKDDKGDAICFGFVSSKIIKNARSEYPIWKIQLPIEEE